MDKIEEFIELSEAVSKRTDEINNELKDSLEILRKAKERVWELYFRSASHAN